MSIDKIARIFTCHRSTVARDIERAKALLFETTCHEYCDLAGASEAEFRSVLRAVPAYFDASLERLLVGLD